MGVMKSVGDLRRLPAHANVQADVSEYVVQLDVADFTERELSVELVDRTVAVRGDQLESPDDEGAPLRLHERLEESFRLPDDADEEGVSVLFTHGTLEFHIPRTLSEPRQLPIGSPGLGVNPDAAAI